MFSLKHKDQLQELQKAEKLFLDYMDIQIQDTINVAHQLSQISHSLVTLFYVKIDCNYQLTEHYRIHTMMYGGKKSLFPSWFTLPFQKVIEKYSSRYCLSNESDLNDDFCDIRILVYSKEK